MKETINWDELREKVKADELAEKKYSNKCDCHDYNNLDIELNINDKIKNDDSQYDFYDEHGILDSTIDPNQILNLFENKEISDIAWNKKETTVKDGNFLGWGKPGIFDNNIKNLLNQTSDIKCKHFDADSNTVGEVYIYPINDLQRVCLCKYCNANLASKMFEQIALETFIQKS